MLLLIDNYDSFVFNLARYFERLGQPTRTVRNDQIGVDEIRLLRPRAVVLSPGPCAPDQAGCSLAVVQALAGEVPLLGVCLGHQAIAQAFGARIVRAQPVHGRSSAIHHNQQGVFAGLPSPFEAGRYHSLVVDEATLPSALSVTARSDDGTIMALEHRRYPVYGVQFHPESILTPLGYRLLEQFLRCAGIQDLAPLPTWGTELAPAPASPEPVFQTPPTF